MKIIAEIGLLLLSVGISGSLLGIFRKNEKWQISWIELAGLLLSSAILLPVWLPLERIASSIPEGWKGLAFAMVVLCLFCGGTILYGPRWRRTSEREQLDAHWFLKAVNADKRLLLFSFGMLVFSLLLTAALWDGDILRQGIGAILLVILFGFHLELLQHMAENQMLRQYSKELSNWQIESRDYMNVIRSQRHDFNLHIHALLGMIDSHEYDVCHEYMEKLAEEASEINDIMPVCDPVVGSMLYRMREEARSKGSEIHYRITYDLRDTRCSGFECVKIIGNLIQNAVDALQTPEDQKEGIQVSIFKRRGNTVVVVENRFTQDPSVILPVFQVGYSTKAHHDGLGLPMVKRTVEKLGGQIYPEFETEKIRFVVTIPNTVNLSAEIS